MDRYTKYTDINTPDTQEADYYMNTNHHLMPMTVRQLANLDLFSDPDSLFAMGCGGNFLC
jgi:hypothetical protein